MKAIYSRSLKSATALAEGLSGVDLYSDDHSGKTYHDLLLRSDIKAVIIALPILSQPEYIEAALLAGKHVLSEKPIAKDLVHANKLIKFYESKVDKSKATWAVAENFRFLESFRFGAQEARKMGKVLGFRVRLHTFVKPGTKYFGRFLACLPISMRILTTCRNFMAQKARISRWLLAGWWSALCRRYEIASGNFCEAGSCFGFHQPSARASTTC